MLPRRHFYTESSKTTNDIIRTRDAFNQQILDENDVAGAEVVKDVLDTQVNLGLRTSEVETDISLLETQILTLQDNLYKYIGEYEEFEIEFNLYK